MLDVSPEILDYDRKIDRYRLRSDSQQILVDRHYTKWKLCRSCDSQSELATPGTMPVTDASRTSSRSFVGSINCCPSGEIVRTVPLSFTLTALLCFFCCSTCSISSLTTLSYTYCKLRLLSETCAHETSGELCAKNLSKWSCCVGLW